MTRIALSPAAAGLVRALVGRAGVARNRILLTDAQSTDWRSLTFTGERHLLGLQITGADSRAVTDGMITGLDDWEFSIPGIIVADIGVTGSIDQAPDGSTCVMIEALTVSDD